MLGKTGRKVTVFDTGKENEFGFEKSRFHCIAIAECYVVLRILTRWPNGWCAGIFIERSGFTAFCSWESHLYSHSASLHPGVLMGTGELTAGGNPAMD